MLNKIKNVSYKIFIEYFGLIVIALIALDLITKAVMQNILANNKVITVIPGIFDFKLVYNTGAFAGWFGTNAGHIILIVISFIGAGALGYALYYFRHKSSIWFNIGLVLALAGDIGNLVDRLVYVNGQPRGVIDFLHFHIDAIKFNWPVFNIADMILVIGVILVAVFLIVDDVKKEKIKRQEIDELERQKQEELKKGQNLDGK